MGLTDSVKNFFRSRDERNVERDSYPVTLNQLLEQMSYLGTTYPLNQTMTGTGGEERISANFAGIVSGAAKSNGVVFACMLARQMLFQEARFQFRTIEGGRPGRFFGNPALLPLEKPWTNGTTGDLLARAIQMVDIAGNSFITRTENGLAWLRPDWTRIVSGSPKEDAGIWDISSEVIGYLYFPGGPGSGVTPDVILAPDMAHWAPIPDPVARFRGMSWIQTLITDIEADTAASLHKRQFFANGATVNLMVKFPDAVETLEAFQAWKGAFNDEHQGALNAYKTLFVSGAGSDAKTIGSNFQEIELKATQGAGETRIAAAAGVPPVIAGLSEGLQGSSLNSGNYDAAFRRFTDLTIRPLWRNFCGSMESIIKPPQSNSQLWYDDRDIPALRQDEKERAEIEKLQAEAVSQLIMQGFTPESVVQAIATGEFSKLKHSGLPSVQLQKPGQALPQGNGTPAALPTAT